MIPSFTTIVVLMGTGLLGANAGLIGSLALLRRRALMGDALAHAALPGIGVAFLIVGERSLPALLAGALASGLLGVAVVALLARNPRVKDDAAIGLVLSVFFGAGVVLSRIVQNQTTTGSKAGLDSFILGKTAGILLEDVAAVAVLALISLTLVIALFKEFQVALFDPAYAESGGWPVLWLDLLLLGLIAIAVVAGLPAVGVVLMAALLILPGAAARCWTDRLGPMLALASAFGLVIGVVGTLASASAPGLPAGPIIVLVGTGVFLISLFVAPRRGILARWLRMRGLRRRIERGEPLGPEMELA